MTSLDDQGHLAFNSTPELERYEAYADNPVPLVFRELDDTFPGSKFILSYRAIDEWVSSVRFIFKEWWDSWQYLEEGALINACHRALYGTDGFDEERCRAAYERHNQAVRTYFRDRPDDFLEIDVTHGIDWPAICTFLNAPLPDVPFPHHNRRQPSGIRDPQMLEEVIKCCPRTSRGPSQ